MDLIPALAGLAKPPVIFLDYDGTLTPIVSDPRQAKLSPDIRDILARLAERTTVAILSGRDREDVKSLIGLNNLYYAGSHGFDMSGPGGFRCEFGAEFLPSIERAEQELLQELTQQHGISIERKKYAIAVHYRQASVDAAHHAGRVARQIAHHYDNLAFMPGKKIFELRPDMPWDKGRALLAILEARNIADATPVLIGDDTTDEDGFRVLKGQESGHNGIGILVTDTPRETLADYSLKDPEAVGTFLNKLCEAL